MSAAALTSVDTRGIPRGTTGRPRSLETRVCAHPDCDVVFRPCRAAQRCCSRSCGSRLSAETRETPLSELTELLPDALIWRRRNLGVDALQEYARAFPLNSINQNLRRRGYRYEQGAPGCTYMIAAPCRDCDRQQVPLEQLNDRQQCRVCRPLFGGVVARAVA